MEPVDETIVRHYESTREEDRIAEGFAQLELFRVQEVLRRYLPEPPAEVVDIGGGTGVHARWLAEAGYNVRLLDISRRQVTRASADLRALGGKAELGDARQLPVADSSYDVVLLFGPLYHLTEREDRLLALREAIRVARPNGVIAVAAISRFASLFDGLSRQFLFAPGFIDVVKQDLATGQHRNPEDRPHWFTTAFFHHPDELRSEVQEAGLHIETLVGLEGLAGYLAHLGERWAGAKDRELILWSARAVEAEPALLGLSAHLLLVAIAPSG